MRRNRWSAALALPLTVAIAATACGGSSSGGGGKSNGGGGGSTKASGLPAIDIGATPVDQVKDGGTMVMAIEQFGPQWNYNQVNGTEAGMAQAEYFFMPQPTITDEHANVSFNPDYWTSAKEISTNPQKIEWVLNPKAKWSDGTPITAQDFITQWKALNGTNKKFNVAGTSGYDQISSVVQGKDQFDVIATFSSPYSEWQPLFNPLYPAKYQKDPKTFDNAYNNAIPATAGPFKFAGFDKSAQTLTVVRDPNWWGTKPKLDKVVFKTLDSTAATQAFANGEVDVITSIANVASAYKAAAASRTGHVTVAGGPLQRHFTFHNGGILADVNVRRAIAMGTDRLAFAKSDLTGLPIKNFATLDNHFFLPGQQGYQDNSGSVGKYDVNAAKQALDAAGWKMGSNGFRSKNGKELKLNFVIPSGTASSANEANLFQPMMKQIGVNIVIKTVPTNDFFDKYVIPGNYDITPFTWQGTAFPVGPSVGIYQCKGGQNYTGMCDPVIDQDLKDALAASDRSVYFAKTNDADKHVWDEVHSLMLFQRLDLNGVKNGLVNIGSFGVATWDVTKIGFKK